MWKTTQVNVYVFMYQLACASHSQHIYLYSFANSHLPGNLLSDGSSKIADIPVDGSQRPGKACLSTTCWLPTDRAWFSTACKLYAFFSFGPLISCNGELLFFDFDSKLATQGAWSFHHNQASWCSPVPSPWQALCSRSSAYCGGHDEQAYPWA